MSKVLLLYTNFGPPYWSREGKPAKYTKRSFRKLPDWNELQRSLPIPALGIHFGDFSYLRFSYMMVIGMEQDDREIPTFDYQCVGESGATSDQLLRTLRDPQTGTLFETRESATVLNMLNTLAEQPPQEWLDLLGGTKPQVPAESWRDWIGQRFLRLFDTKISNDDFEDIVAETFRALGFEVVQMGHRRPGSYPDGTLVAAPSDFAIVYDCKNSSNYYPIVEHQRAISDYVQKEGKRLQEQKRVRSVYSAIVARSFAQAELVGADIFVSAEDLLYALYKRLRLGKDFTLTAFDEVTKRSRRMDKRFMDQAWVELSAL